MRPEQRKKLSIHVTGRSNSGPAAAASDKVDDAARSTRTNDQGSLAAPQSSDHKERADQASNGPVQDAGKEHAQGGEVNGGTGAPSHKKKIERSRVQAQNMSSQATRTEVVQDIWQWKRQHAVAASPR